MSKKRNRLVFAGLVVTLSVLLFFFSEPVILWVLLLTVALAFLSAQLLHIDVRRINVKMDAPSGGRIGRDFPITITISQSRKLYTAKYAVIEVELSSTMLGRSRRQTFCVPLRSQTEQITYNLTPHICGEIRLNCVSVRIWDILEISSIKGSAFHDRTAVFYPVPIETELTFERMVSGASSSEEKTLSRPGHDPSETFDIKEYAPGDDVRSINWKLSTKTDALVVRQPSDPAQYDVALLPDIGIECSGKPISNAELNCAVALMISVGEKLLRQNTPFCLAIPTVHGIELSEVRDTRAFHLILPKVLCLRVLHESGIGIRYFASEHMERYFTKLVVISAGEYAPSLAQLDNRLSISVISSYSGSTVRHTSLGPDREAVYIPAEQNAGECLRLSF